MLFQQLEQNLALVGLDRVELDRQFVRGRLGRGHGRAGGGLAHRLTTRKVPDLHFAFDDSIERGVRLSRLIDEAVAPPPPAAPQRRRRPG